jgi:hypothetical protein
LENHQIDKVKTGYSPNNIEHELFYVDLLPRHFWYLFAMDAPLRGVLILKGESTLITCDNGAEFVHRHALSQ